MLCLELLGVGHGGRPETLAEPDLIVLGQMLIPEEDNQTLVPCIENLRKYLIAHRFAQINTRDFGANSWSQLLHIDLLRRLSRHVSRAHATLACSLQGFKT